MPDLRPVFFTQGWFLIALGAVMGFPALADIQAGQGDWEVFAASAMATLFAGGALMLSSSRQHVELNLKQGFLLTATSWPLISAFAALPFLFSSLDIGFTDAFFEAISGLTTTGSTVLTGLDALPPGILLWRSLLQWMGGVGIIVMAVAMLPFLRVGGMQLFRTESSDRSDKALPRAAQIATAITTVYLALTVACALAYRIGGMTGFEAINHAMTTLSTGGYSTSDASMAHFTQPSLQWVATVFMLLASLPFVLYVKAIHGDRTALLKDSQVRTLLTFLGIVVSLLALWLFFADHMPIAEALRLAAFNVVSVVTTTGYVTADYSLWGSFPTAVFFLLTFVGGCTGSTAGGLKIMRFEVMTLVAHKQAMNLLQPHGTHTLRYGGRPLPGDVLSSVGIFMFLFIASAALLALALGALGLDFETSISGAVTAIANVGPGLGGTIGPSGDFSTLPDAAKWLLSVGMLLGRLEFSTVLVLFLPAFWRF